MEISREIHATILSIWHAHRSIYARWPVNCLSLDSMEPSFQRRAHRAQALQPGGVILFARNIDSPRQTHALLKAAQKEADTPLFRCVDMEGGTVDRLKDVIAPAPSVQEVVQAGHKPVSIANMAN